MLNRSIAPKSFFNSEIPNLNYQSTILDNGLPIYSISNNSLAICGMEIVISSGKLNDTVPGVSSIATQMLTSGTSNHSASEINHFFEQRGAFIQMQPGTDYSSFNLYCLSSVINQVLPLFAELFYDSVFTEEKLAKQIEKHKQSIQINEQKTAYWAAKNLGQSLFGTHPYGQRVSLSNLNKIDRNQVVNYWENAKGKIKFITLTGNYNPSQIELINKNFGVLPYLPDKNEETTTAFSPKPETQSKLLKQSQQASLKIGSLTLPPNHKDYPTLFLANTILGGYFGSRLMQTIREEKGLTYGINSSIIHLAKTSYLQISADVKKGSIQKVIELIFKEIDLLISKKVGKEERTKVIHYLVGDYFSSSDTIFDKTSKIKYLKLHNLPDNYYINIFNKLIKNTPQEIQNAALKNLKADHFCISIAE